MDIFDQWDAYINNGMYNSLDDSLAEFRKRVDGFYGTSKEWRIINHNHKGLVHSDKCPLCVINQALYGYNQ